MVCTYKQENSKCLRFIKKVNTFDNAIIMEITDAMTTYKHLLFLVRMTLIHMIEYCRGFSNAVLLLGVWHSGYEKRMEPNQ